MLTAYLNPLNMSSISDLMPYDADMETPLRFGEWLADLIHAADMDQSVFADMIGVVPSAVSNWIGGGNLPRRRVLPEMARVLGVDVGEVVSRYEAEKKRKGSVSKPEEVRAAQRRRRVQMLAGVPASRTRWIDVESEQRMIELPEDWLRDLRSPSVAVQVSGNCLAARGIYDGDVVICERETDHHAISQGRVVLVRIEDEYTLKVWYWVGTDQAELRDGDGAVIATLSAGVDFEVIGIARKRFGDVL